MIKVYNILKKFYWLTILFGIDLRKMFRSFMALPRYVRDVFRFYSKYSGSFELRPCLHDWRQGAGAINSEYFWQDLFVAKKIFETKPVKHVDIGSRIDGFVAHVASFREIEVFDIRPITTQIPGVIFRQFDLMEHVENMDGYCDSLSCLHALEHFGLGRYGDSIDPKGFEYGFANMARLLKVNGVFYLSVPVGIERVEFNAHRVFDPQVIVDLANKNSLQLFSLTVIWQGCKVEEVALDELCFSALARERYVLGIFVFKKVE